MYNRIKLFVFSVVCGCSLSIASAAFASEYYMVLFGSEGVPNIARASHVFATFVELNGNYGTVSKEVTISWLPAQGYFGPDYMMPVLAAVPGHNYTLDETLAMSRHRRFQYWGPYQIAPELFQRAVNRDAFLNSGTTSYKMIILNQDMRGPAVASQPGGFSNCIMAVSDLGGYFDTGLSWGFDASKQVLGWLSRWVYAYPASPVRYDVAQKMHLRERLGQ